MEYEISLAGNPNVGKSTIFNALTGMHQHTGNWAGKTVSNAVGYLNIGNDSLKVYDLPGTYSLIAHSKEELVARDYICFGGSKAIVVVCDAMMLERNLNLVLQTIEITPHVIVVVNLIEEAKKKGIIVDLDKLSDILGVPVIGTEARSNMGLDKLKDTILDVVTKVDIRHPYLIRYEDDLEERIEVIKSYLDSLNLNISTRWLAIRLLTNDKDIIKSVKEYLDYDLIKDNYLQDLLNNYDININIEDRIITTIVNKTYDINKEVTIVNNKNYDKKMRKIDKIMTSKLTGIPIMLLMLFIIFWLTIVGSNYPSEFLYNLLFGFEDTLYNLLSFLPTFFRDMLVYGMYRTVAWVVSVMLPPMAIFFPLFTLLEDLGYLPRIAFNLDKYFHKCNSCGKQALCMCMGFGCNAVGVTGARIIDSKRERLIAILTNVFVPCNGRFPMIIALISMFFVGSNNGLLGSIYSALMLLLVIIIGIGMTFLVSFILSKTILKGEPSSFTLELPQYRKPQVGKVIIRSIFDRTLHVLGRAIVVAAPAGLLIFLLSNLEINSISIFSYMANFLDSFAGIIGVDGIIILAFLLGFPANEIVIPIMLMGYLNTGMLTDYSGLDSLKEILVDNGWTLLTAINVIMLSLFHFPCSTTCLTIKKETNSWFYTILAFIIPTVIGICICFGITSIFGN